MECHWNSEPIVLLTEYNLKYSLISIPSKNIFKKNLELTVFLQSHKLTMTICVMRNKKVFVRFGIQRDEQNFQWVLHVHIAQIQILQVKKIFFLFFFRNRTSIYVNSLYIYMILGALKRTVFVC